MQRTSISFAAALLVPALAAAVDYDLGALAKAGKLELFNRTLDPAKAGAPEVAYLNPAANDGLAWIPGAELGDGTIEVDIKGKDQRGQSFAGIAFHGVDNKSFDGVYLRPFNFGAEAAEQRSHAIQYISMPNHDWSTLRTKFPGKYEAALDPAPAADSWVRLKVVIAGRKVSAYVNGAANPALAVELLSSVPKGKLGVWVGNGSDGWFRNLKVTPK